MSPIRRAGSEKEGFHGVRQIIRFNWPYYVIGPSAILFAAALIIVLPLGRYVRMFLYCGVFAVLWWIAASLAVSWIVYDCSPLMGAGWVVRMLGGIPASWISIHAGFDEITPRLQVRFDGSRGHSYDIFDPNLMTEASIFRARHRSKVDAEAADYRWLRAASGSADAVFLLLSAHELRLQSARVDLLREVHRLLTPAGRVVVAEHLRDLSNFIAYGPGFLHFFSRRAWRRAFAGAGFAVQDERSITPFVRAFLLRRA